MSAEARAAIERTLLRKIGAVRNKLRELPDQAWTKAKVERQRDHLAAQLRALEAQLMQMRQMGLFPKKIRREGENG